MCKQRWRKALEAEMTLHDEDDEGPNLDLIVVLILAAVAVGGLTDLVLDAPRRFWSAHVVFELCLILLSLGAATYLARGWMASRASLREVRRSLVERQRERDAWRASAEKVLAGLGREVGRQFAAWGLTPAERDTALMLIQGYSVRRIAALAKRSERTVRQHAVAVYRKSGLSNRAELAGFFLGDLLVPEHPGSEVAAGKP
jgi:DNA-binding CsgD family transcriptional regulator